MVVLSLLVVACERSDLESGVASADLAGHSREQVSIDATQLTAFDLSRAPGLVVDPDKKLWHFRRSIELMSKGWHRDLGIDFQVVVVSGVDEPIETLTTALFELRRVGQGAPTGGILLVVNPATAQAMITTSYNLEAAFTDGILGHIARFQLAQYASYSILGMAVADVLHVLKDVAIGRAARGDFAIAAEYRSSADFRRVRKYLSGGGGALTALSDVPIDLDLKRRLSIDERARYAASEDPIESANALVRVQRDLIGDPSLELFTMGSRVQRSLYPFAVYEQTQRMEALVASKPWHVVVRGDRAVVTSRTPVFDFVPVLLHRIDGRWLVDLVETWKNLGVRYDGSHYEANRNNPYHFELSKLGPGPFLDVAALDLGGANPADLLDRLSRMDGALFRYLEGEILFRNCFVYAAALEAYERASNEAPTSLAFAARLGDRASHVVFLDLAADAYQRLGAAGLLDRARSLARADRDQEAVADLERLLTRNPFDIEALHELERQATLIGPKREAQVSSLIQELSHDGRQRHETLEVQFDPPHPVLEIPSGQPKGDREFSDVTHFEVRFRNLSRRTVRLESISVSRHGITGESVIGDILSSLTFPNDAPQLEPNQVATLERGWGSSNNSSEQQVSYLFNFCWRGVGESERQCASSRVDAFPR